MYCLSQKETKILHISELFVEINLQKDDPNHSCTTLFVQVCAIKKIIHMCKIRSYFGTGNILHLRCCTGPGRRHLVTQISDHQLCTVYCSTLTPLLRSITKEGPATHLCLVLTVCRSNATTPHCAGPPRGMQKTS